MNKQEFNIAGGYPLETDTLDEMQKSYSLLNALGEIAGDKAILKGCVRTGNTVSDGVVYLNGEVLPLRGGNWHAVVYIKQEATCKEFANGKSHEVFYERYLTFGYGDDNMPWSDFKRYRLVEEVAEFKDKVKDELAGKAPIQHNHDSRYYTQGQTDAFFAGEKDGKKQVNWDQIKAKPTSYPPGIHNHDDRYYEKYYIRDYAYLTESVYYILIGSKDGDGLDPNVAGRIASFYASDRCCCYIAISDLSIDPHDNSPISALRLGFAKMKITR